MAGSTTITVPAPNAGSGCALQEINACLLTFQGKQCAGNPGDAFPDFYISIAGPDPDIPPALAFRDTACGYFDAPTSGDPTNVSNLDALTAQFATDFLSWIGFTGDTTYLGVVAVAPLPVLDEVIIDYFDEGVCKTRVLSPPVIGFPRELGHYDPSGDCTLTATPCTYFYGPPGQCVNGTLQLTRYQLCLQDGRLAVSFVSTDNIT